MIIIMILIMSMLMIVIVTVIMPKVPEPSAPPAFDVVMIYYTICTYYMYACIYIYIYILYIPICIYIYIYIYTMYTIYRAWTTALRAPRPPRRA